MRKVLPPLIPMIRVLPATLPQPTKEQVVKILEDAKAEVMAGGVDTAELSSQTLESRQPGLYFIGEVVDVTGWLGGYNFQWAWASAHACANGLAARLGQA